MVKIIEELFRKIYDGLVGFAGITFVVWFFIIPAPKAVLKAGRSKSNYKKLIKSFSFIDRLLKKGYLENTKVCLGYQKFFIACNYIAYFWLLLLVVICFASLFTNDFVQLFRPYLFLKECLVEIPLSIFTLWNYRSVNTLRKKGYWTCNWKFLLTYDKQAKKYYNK
ncbi:MULTISPECIES: hypothetical protein [unclassified Ruminococcus]|uniref:hypothetical protein n=1 Tax=unclassified Ruminococcus TaxID=2608920 RepID=UPI00210973CB|nr:MULTISPECIES: hypothetical protein [unclassified Ruminococcus]MCQ4021690.1 hypothetical protein [Ruminococcus sp. zg-924]MCQ4114135.1 hypothetical protein [Ruminococcus sp. zg-921]